MQPLYGLVQSLKQLCISPVACSKVLCTVEQHFSTSQVLQKHKPWKLRPPLHMFRSRMFPSRVVVGGMPEKYTMKKLRMEGTGGRDPVTGRIVNHRIGGGAKRRYRMIDTVRSASDDANAPPVEEWVQRIAYDPNRTARIAVVAGAERKRYILASENMKAGDIIKTYGHIPRIAVKAYEGDSYPLGALPVGTSVFNIERFPGEGGKIARAAGTSCKILRKVDDFIILQMPSKAEVSVSKKCMAVVGRASNVDHGSKPIGSPNRHRWLGVRPRTGRWHRKTGYHGRKIRPPKPLKVYDVKKTETSSVHTLTL